MEPGHHNSLKHTHPRKISSEEPFPDASSLFGPFKHLKVRKSVSPHYPIPAACVDFLLPRSHLKKGKKKKIKGNKMGQAAPLLLPSGFSQHSLSTFFIGTQLYQTYSNSTTPASSCTTKIKPGNSAEDWFMQNIRIQVEKTKISSEVNCVKEPAEVKAAASCLASAFPAYVLLRGTSSSSPCTRGRSQPR